MTKGRPLTSATAAVIEHDGSLSRSDFALGNNHSFNRTIFNSVAAYFRGKDVISVRTAAEARVARINAARAANPQFTFGAQEDRFSQFESALYLRVFGKPSVGNAKRKWVEIMFRELPSAWLPGMPFTSNLVWQWLGIQC